MHQQSGFRAAVSSIRLLEVNMVVTLNVRF
jgi:hypothetical protein